MQRLSKEEGQRKRDGERRLSLRKMQRKTNEIERESQEQNEHTVYNAYCILHMVLLLYTAKNLTLYSVYI